MCHGEVVTRVDVEVLGCHDVMVVRRFGQVVADGAGQRGATGYRQRATLAEVVLHVDDDQRPHTSTIRSGDCPGSLPTDAAATDIGSMTPRRSRT